jgi:hypothetical protein
MNSIHRVGLTIAAAVTILTVAGALLVQAYVSTRTAAAGPTASPVEATESPTDTAAPTPSLDPETVYVQAVPTPAIITIRKTAKPVVQTVPKAPPPVVHVVVTAPPGEGDDGPGDR